VRCACRDDFFPAVMHFEGEEGERRGDGEGEGTCVANAKKKKPKTQNLLEESNQQAAPFLTQPSSS